MSSSFHLKDWKDASETFQDMFSKLSIARDRSTSIINSEQPMKPKGKDFLFLLKAHVKRPLRRYINYKSFHQFGSHRIHSASTNFIHFRPVVDALPIKLASGKCCEHIWSTLY